jgi:hypothetical protein
MTVTQVFIVLSLTLPPLHPLLYVGAKLCGNIWESGRVSFEYVVVHVLDRTLWSTLITATSAILIPLIGSLQPQVLSSPFDFSFHLSAFRLSQLLRVAVK